MGMLTLGLVRESLLQKSIGQVARINRTEGEEGNKAHASFPLRPSVRFQRSLGVVDSLDGSLPPNPILFQLSIQRRSANPQQLGGFRHTTRSSLQSKHDEAAFPL